MRMTPGVSVRRGHFSAGFRLRSFTERLTGGRRIPSFLSTFGTFLPRSLPSPGRPFFRRGSVPLVRYLRRFSAMPPFQSVLV